MTRRAYPGDIDDDTSHFLVPYLVLKPEFAAQRRHPLREVLNALFWVARTGAQWAYLPHDFRWREVVRSQAQRRFEAGCFENAAHDLRLLSRVQHNRKGDPTAVIIDSRTLQRTPESGSRAGFDDAQKRKGTKVHIAVDTLGHLLAVLTSPPSDQGLYPAAQTLGGRAVLRLAVAVPALGTRPRTAVRHPGRLPLPRGLPSAHHKTEPASREARWGAGVHSEGQPAP